MLRERYCRGWGDRKIERKIKKDRSKIKFIIIEI